MCTMQGKNDTNGKERCKAWGGGTNSIAPYNPNIKTIKDYER